MKINSLSDIKPDKNNANKGTKRGRGMVESSLRETGAGRSIVVDKDGRVIAGNKTLETWADIANPDDVLIVPTDGKKLVVVQRQDLDLSDDTGLARKLAYYDNRTSQVGLEWDTSEILGSMNAGLDLSFVFDQPELDDLFGDLINDQESADAEPQIDKAEELRARWGVQLGQLWRLPSRDGKGEHRLICGDCTDRAVVDKVMGGERADCVVTDPPYGVGKAKWDESFPTGWIDICWYFSDRMLVTPGNSHLIDAANCIGRYKDLLALHATNGMTKSIIAFGNWTPVLACGEWKWKARQSYLGYSVSISEDILHPSPKPMKGWGLLVENYTDAGDLILDPFLGSGTTLIACENLSRYCRAIEVSPAYVAVALQRYTDAFGVQPELVG